MEINDRIYGKITIENPLIIDLIHSKPFQRLKGISQDGAVHFIQPKRNITRYEHCIGTWYLSYTFKRPIEEQVASLLHDIPHTAFSHVIDYVMKNEDQEYHDTFLTEVVLSSEIPSLCKKHNLQIEGVLKAEKFPLLSNKLPDISFDRWDYFMRDSFTFQILPKEMIALFLKNMREKDERFYFDDVSIASLFANLFFTSNRLIWMDPTSHGSYFLLSEAISIGLKENIITHKDFFLTDDVVMEKLQKSSNLQIKKLLDRLKPGVEFSFTSKEDAEFYGPLKPRFVNPRVMVDGEFKQVFDLIPGMQEYFEEFAKQHRYIGVR
jgi:uncharacterized protein